jgi:hypothetical protein
MYYVVPTNRVEEYPSGLIEKQVRVLPRGIGYTIQRDALGGTDADALAIPWQAVLYSRDPRELSLEPVDVTFAETTVVTGATGVASTNVITSTGHDLVNAERIYFTALTGGTGLVVGTAYYVISSATDTFKVSLTSGGAEVDFTVDLSAGSWARVVTAAGDLVNRGDYHAHLNALFQVGAGAGTIVVSAGGSTFTITVPASTGTRIIRYKGEDKLLTVTESDAEDLRLSLLTFAGQATHPLVSGGSSPYSVTFTGVTLEAGSHMWFWESFA